MPECCPEFLLRKSDLGGTSDGAKLSFLVQIDLPVVPVGTGGVGVDSNSGELVGFFRKNARQAFNLLRNFHFHLQCSSHTSFFPTGRASPVEEQENFRVTRFRRPGGQKGSKRNAIRCLHRSCCILVISSLTMAVPTAFPILQQATREPHAHEKFSASRALEEKLRQVVRGEVRFDQASRALYATDASNYRQVPIGLVLPLDEADVVAAVAACREFGAPVLSRGGGTSLSGQCCNVAVVLDFSKYMHSILELDPARKFARVQRGIVLDRLRDAAEVHDLTFAPDPATHSRCTLGGMIGNNSCGVHALMGGKTVDNIESLDILLYDGARMTVGPTTEAELQKIIAGGGRRGEIYAGLARIRDTYSELIHQRFPQIPRRVSGYNLDELLPENGFNVARALVGSEGTCVTVLEPRCTLKHSPQHRRLVVLGFADPFIAADYVPAVLAHKPIGL